MICHECNFEIAGNARFCPKCGTPAVQSAAVKSDDPSARMKKCSLCETEYPPSAMFCKLDGKALMEADLPAVPEARQETVAIGLICPVCGTSNPYSAKFCKVDGTALHVTESAFSSRESEVNRDADGNCDPSGSANGAQWQHLAQGSREPEKSRPRMMIWGLLAIILLGAGTAGGYFIHNIQVEKREKAAQLSTNAVQNTPTTQQESNPQPPPTNEPERTQPVEPQPATQQVPGKYPDASLRTLTEVDFSGMSKFDLKIMRNEIFARHGYIFRTPDMQSYFRNAPWYVPRFADVMGMLTQIEKANIESIKRHER